MQKLTTLPSKIITKPYATTVPSSFPKLTSFPIKANEIGFRNFHNKSILAATFFCKKIKLFDGHHRANKKKILKFYKRASLSRVRKMSHENFIECVAYFFFYKISQVISIGYVLLNSILLTCKNFVQKICSTSAKKHS